MAKLFRGPCTALRSPACRGGTPAGSRAGPPGGRGGRERRAVAAHVACATWLPAPAGSVTWRSCRPTPGLTSVHPITVSNELGGRAHDASAGERDRQTSATFSSAYASVCRRTRYLILP